MVRPSDESAAVAGGTRITAPRFHQPEPLASNLPAQSILTCLPRGQVRALCAEGGVVAVPGVNPRRVGQTVEYLCLEAAEE